MRWQARNDLRGPDREFGVIALARVRSKRRSLVAQFFGFIDAGT